MNDADRAGKMIESAREHLSNARKMLDEAEKAADKGDIEHAVDCLFVDPIVSVQSYSESLSQEMCRFRDFWRGRDHE